MSGEIQKAPALIILQMDGVATQTTVVRECLKTGGVQLCASEHSGRALLLFAEPLWESALGTVELDAPACRHLASLLSRKADELEAVAAILKPSPIPARYVAATWRDMTPIDPEKQEIGIGFETSEGPIFLRLFVADVAHIADQFRVTCGDRDGTFSQSMSAGDGDRSDVFSPEGMS